MGYFERFTMIRGSYYSNCQKNRDKFLKNPEALKKLDREAASKLLWEAVRMNYADIIELIFQLKANVDPLELAIIRGDLKSAESFLSEGKIKFCHGKVIDRMFWKKDTRKDMLALFLKYDLDVSIKNVQGDNIFHDFIISYTDKDDNDVIDIVEILINSGIPVNESNNSGWTPLHLSTVYKPNIKLVELLIQKGADVNKKCLSEASALHGAAENGNAAIFNYLVSSGADISAVDIYGSTLLHVACGYHNEHIIDILLRKGANISIKNKSGETPFSKLNPDEDSYDSCLCAMVKEFSKLSFQNLSVSSDDMEILQNDPTAKDYFEKCVNELHQMENIQFYSNYSYYFVMKMSKNIKKLAFLVRNKTFVLKFKENLHKFCFYKNYLQRILDEAVECLNKSLIVEQRLKKIFKDFLPLVVIRVLAENLTVENLPLE